MHDDIDDEIMQRIKYLARVFAASMHSTLYSYDDLVQELVVFYRENKDKKRIREIGGWFISFKNHLINLYVKLSVRRNAHHSMMLDQLVDVSGNGFVTHKTLYDGNDE